MAIAKGDTNKEKIEIIQKFLNYNRVPSIKDGKIISAKSPTIDGKFGQITEESLENFLGVKEVSDNLYRRILFCVKFWEGNAVVIQEIKNPTILQTCTNIAFLYALQMFLLYKYIAIYDKIDIDGIDAVTKDPLYKKYNDFYNGGISRIKNVYTANNHTPYTNELFENVALNGLPSGYLTFPKTYFESEIPNYAISYMILDAEKKEAVYKMVMNCQLFLGSMELELRKYYKPAANNTTPTGGGAANGGGNGYDIPAGGENGKTGGLFDGVFANVEQIINLMLILTLLNQIGGTQKRLR